MEEAIVIYPPHPEEPKALLDYDLRADNDLMLDLLHQQFHTRIALERLLAALMAIRQGDITAPRGTNESRGMRD